MKRLLALPLALAMTGIAYAHNGMEHVMGTVGAITATSIDVKTGPESVRTVLTNSKTMWMKGKAMMKPAELHVGDRVVIHARLVDGKLVAAEVETATPAHAH
jgi:Cu/Ag efflux protein CusF